MSHDVSHLPASPVWYETYGTDDTRDAVQRWQALVDARLIGNILPTPPEVAAQREANDALFRRRAADYAAARREYGL